MKKIIIRNSLTILLVLGTSLFSASLADNPGPPPPPPQGGQGGNQTGGSAPLDGGLSLLLVMGMGYGAKKVFSTRKSFIR